MKSVLTIFGKTMLFLLITASFSPPVSLKTNRSEFNLRGEKDSLLRGYLFENGQWKHILFKEIPEAIYAMNLSFDSGAYVYNGRITLADQARELNDPDAVKYLKRIDSNHRFTNDN